MKRQRAWIWGLGAMVAPAVATAGLCERPDEALSRLSMVQIQTPADRAYAKSLGTVVADRGHYLVVSGVAAGVRKALGGQLTESEVSRLDTRIMLRNLAFDPADQVPESVRLACAAAKSGAESLYIVQLAAPADDAALAQLRSLGLDVLQYLPQQAFLVKASRAAIEDASDLPSVRWAGVVPASAKLPPPLDWVYAKPGDKPQGDYGKNAPSVYDVGVLKGFGLPSVRNAIMQRGGQPAVLAESVLPGNFFDVLRVRLAPADLKAIAELPGVIAIDPYIAPTREDERAAQIVAGNFTGNTLSPPGYNPATQFGVNGNNVTVAVVDDGVGIPGDGGFYVTPSNAVNGPLRGATAGAAGHGHLQASIIAGTTPFSSLDPTGYNYGVGIAPSAHIVNIPLLRAGYAGTEADTANDAVVTAGPNGVPANISNNSWGAGTNGNAYDLLAAQFDGFVRDASTAASVDPLLIVFSAGNQGANGLTRPKVAKNVISVAASENLRTEIDTTSDNLQEVADFSSRGLAADGRVKPDITAPGQAVTGGRSGPDALFGNIDPNHRWSSGTSHAAPQVAGVAALFTQWWKSQNAGANPSPALVKAALLNGATEMTGTTTAASIPNGAEGWGRVNVGRMLNTGVATQYVNQTENLSDVGSSRTLVGTVSTASAPVRVSLVWTDPPGVADPALVNNLDLEVSVGGTVYRGNVFNAGSSVAGGAADVLNNVEQVLLPAGIPAGTPIAATVRATALNGDGVPGNADTTDQHYALVVHNAAPASAPVISVAGANLVSGSCTPNNGAVDPGETVTVNLSLQNGGNLNTTNLVASLQPTGGVTAPGAAQAFGVLVAGGPAVTRPFSFRASGSCGGTITATLALQDGATNLGNVSYSFNLGGVNSATVQFNSTAAISIAPLGAGNPYPANIAVSGLPGTVSKVVVRLNGFTHLFPDDVDVLLVGPAGQRVLLMSDVGGSTDAVNLDLVLDDAAAAGLPDSSSLVAGTFRPTNFGAIDAFAAPAPATPYGSTLAAFNGSNPNGTWSLYVMDDLTGDGGSFAGGWGLSITTAAPACATACGAAPGITVNPTSGLTTTEAGGTASFNVVLAAQPTADVTLALSSSDVTEGNVAPSSLTFTGADWSTPQTVTVTGVDDALIDGNIGYNIVTAPASSVDSGYAGINPADVGVTNADNDVSVGGTVAGLSGSGLVLQLNGGNNLAIGANGPFTFPAGATIGSSYAVTVLTQPAGQSCSIANGSGTAGTSNITNVLVTCTSFVTLGGTVSGLAGSGLVLQNNGGSNLAIAANGAFTFAAPIAVGSGYNVTVLTQPGNPAQTCVVTNGSGTAGGTNITNVAVTCTTNTYTIGGTVTGLAGAGLVLQNNGGNNLAVAANGAFTFTTAIASGASYAVTVLTQPGTPAQTCVVANGSGTVGAANITNVAITCTTNTYTIGGTVTGLTGTGLFLQNNGGNNLSVAANGAFTFSTAIASGASYAVTVLTQPGTPAQTCVVANGSGTVGAANVTNVTVNCTTNTYTIGGTVTGLAGTGLVLQNNGGNNLSVAANGAFTFSTAIASGATYAVTVLTQPTGQSCAVTNGSGGVTNANITNVQVSCTTMTIAVSAPQIDFGVVDFAENPTQTLTVTNPGAVNLQLQSATIPAGPFSIIGGTCPPYPRTLPAGASCTIVIAFRPEGFNVAQATLTIGSNAQGAPTLVALRGGALARPVPTLSPIALAVLALLMIAVARSRRP